MQRTVDKKNFVGIVDDLGLESFIEKSKATFPYKLRASLNPQRNAIAYDIWADEATETKVNALLKDGKFEEAGQIIKKLMLPEERFAEGMKIGEEFNNCPGREAIIKRIKSLELDRTITIKDAPEEHQYWQNEPDTLVFNIRSTVHQSVVANIAKLAVECIPDEFDHRVIDGLRYFRLWWD